MLVLTQSDGVDLAFDLQRALVTLEHINHLLQLRLADHQVLRSLLVLLRRAAAQQPSQEVLDQELQTSGGNKQLTTLHFFPSSSSTGGCVEAGAVEAVGREAGEEKGLGPARTGAWLLRLGFLWVF